MFDDIIRLADNFKRLDVNRILFDILSKPEIKELIQELNTDEQLLKGLGSDGKFLIKYVDDPFFKSIKHALAYQNWKKNISPDSSKPEEVADFYINGFFHQSIFAEIKEDHILIDSNADFSGSIEMKEPDVFGLTDDNLQLLIDKISEAIVPKILSEVQAEK